MVKTNVCIETIDIVYRNIEVRTLNTYTCISDSISGISANSIIGAGGGRQCPWRLGGEGRRRAWVPASCVRMRRERREDAPRARSEKDNDDSARKTKTTTTAGTMQPQQKRRRRTRVTSGDAVSGETGGVKEGREVMA